MRGVSNFFLGAALIGGMAAQAQTTPGKTHLKVGDEAPQFTLASTTGQITLSEFRGKKAVVVAFFPAAFTGG